MTIRIDRTRILFLLHHDVQLYEHLCEAELLPRNAQDFNAEQAELARVAGTLVHELDVNWSGVEVILRMRTELVESRRQVAALLRYLREQVDDR